jgi:hypothetical protein
MENSARFSLMLAHNPAQGFKMWQNRHEKKEQEETRMAKYKDTTFRAVYRCFLLYQREAFADILSKNELYARHSHVLVYGFADHQRGLMVDILGFADITDDGRVEVTRLPEGKAKKLFADLEPYEFWLLDAKTMGLADNYKDLISYYDSIVPEQMLAIRDLKALDESRDRYRIDDAAVYVNNKKIWVRLEGIKDHVFTGFSLDEAEGIRKGDEILVTLKLFNGHFYCAGRPAGSSSGTTPAERALLKYRNSKDKRDGRAAMDTLVESEIFVPLNVHNMTDAQKQQLEKELSEGNSQRFTASSLMRPFTSGASGKKSYFPVFTSKQHLKQAMPQAVALKKPLSEIITALMDSDTGTGGVAVNPDDKPVFLIPSTIFPYLKIKKTGEVIPDPEKLN